MLIPFFFDEPIEACEAVLQFGLQMIERLGQLSLAAVVGAPVRFA